MTSDDPVLVKSKDAPAGEQPEDVAQAATDAALERARATGKQVAIDSLNTETSTTYANPDGTFSARLAAEPVRAWSRGRLVPIDTTLELNGDGVLAPKATTAQLSLSGGGSEPLVTMAAGRGVVSYSWSSALPAPRLSGDTATYPDVAPDTDLKVTVTGQGFETFLVVKSRPKATLQPVRLTRTLTGLTSATDAGGNVTLADASGQAVAHGGAPRAWDSSADPASGLPRVAAVPVSVAPSVGESAQAGRAAASVTPVSSAMSLSPPQALLSDPATVYPVTIDPDLSLTLPTWAYVDEAHPSQSYVNNGWDSNQVHVGAEPNLNTRNRALLAFGSRSVLGTKILAAHLDVYESWAWNCTPQVVDVWHTADWNTAAAQTWNNQPVWGQSWASANVAKGYSASCPAGAVGFDVTSMVTNLVAAGKTTFYVGLRAHNEATYTAWKKFRISAGSLTPSIVVTYDRAPNQASAQVASFCFYEHGLNLGDRLDAGQSVTSADGQTSLSMQADGNLVLRRYGQAFWASGTNGGSGGRYASMDNGGNLTVREADGTLLWQTATTSTGLVLQDYGNIVMYNAAGSAVWAPVGPYSVLPAGKVLTSASSMVSDDGQIRLVMQADGNLVYYDAGVATWSSGTSGRTGQGVAATMQADGNLVLRTASGAAVWSSGTAGSGADRLLVDTDGNLLVMAGSAVRWQTNLHHARPVQASPAFQCYLNTTTPTLSATASDPDEAYGDTVKLEMRVYQGYTVAPTQLAASTTTAYKASPNTSTWTPTLAEGSYELTGRGIDSYAQVGAWARYWQAFTIDTTAPAAPAVTSPDFDMTNQTRKGLYQTPGTVVFDGDADVVKYVYSDTSIASLVTPPPCGTASGGVTTVCGSHASASITPTASTNSLHVAAFDRAGNQSPEAVLTFSVSASKAANAKHAWITGTSAYGATSVPDRAGASPSLPLTLTGSAAWTPHTAGGASDGPFYNHPAYNDALRFDPALGAGAATAGALAPVAVDEAHSLTLATWVRPASVGAARAAVSIGGGAVVLGLDATGHAQLCMEAAAGGGADCAVASNQPALAPGQWHLLVGTWNAVTSQLQVNVDDTAHASAAVAHPNTAAAAGPLVLGQAAAGLAGWDGDVADPIVWDNVLERGQINSLRFSLDAVVAPDPDTPLRQAPDADLGQSVSGAGTPPITQTKPPWSLSGGGAGAQQTTAAAAPAGDYTLDLAAAGTPQRQLAGAPATSGAPGWHKLGSSGLSVAAAPSQRQGVTAAASKLTAHVLDKAELAAAGLSGLAVRLARSDHAAGVPAVEVTADPAVLNSLYGGDYASRVRWTQVPDTTGAAQTESVLMATEAEPTSSAGAGSYAATPLSPAGSWQVSAQTGSFSWSYPLRVPPAAAGPAPALSLAYDSGLVDGQTGSTNNQPSAIGQGWNLDGAGFIERSYVPCAQDTGSGSPATGDLCWKTDNATLSFGGHSGTLVRDSGSGQWRLQADDGTRVQRLTGAANGAHDGEHWKVTTPDGTQYYFGLSRLPGWSAGKAETGSTWTVPVFGNDDGEPCHQATFAASACAQAWRWNLDYVVDPHGNSEAFYYQAETNHYAQNLTDANAAAYVRGGQLTRIDYGMRAGTELTVQAPEQVLFDLADRCSSQVGCDPSHPQNWPDVPWDQACDAAPCAGDYSPAFFTTKRLSQIHTRVLSGAGYTEVDSWTLQHSFPDPGDATSAALWLAGVRHTGSVGASVALPPVTFDKTQLQNRVWAVDGLAPLDKYRVGAVHTETGAILSVNYQPAECSPANLPAAAESNAKRCFPQWWTPDDGSPQLDWFHKYPVTSVVNDPNTGGQPDDVTYYDYLGTPAWRYDTSPLTPEDKRTWSQWAGYSKVRIRHGAGSSQTATTYLYFQGLDGDRAAPAGGTRQVQVSASDGSTRTDSLWLAGRVREQITTNGSGGPQVSLTRSDYWASAPTASSGGLTARHVGVSDQTTLTQLSSGGNRTSEVKTSYDADGRATAVDDLGDVAVPADDLCTRTSYADNPTAWLKAFPAEVSTVAKTCSATPSLPADAVSATRTYYDGSPTLGAAPSKGDATRAAVVDSYTGSSPHWQTTSTSGYDTLGRVVTSTDPRLGAPRTTTTAYTPAAAGPLTQTVVTNPLGWTTTTGYAPAWGSPAYTVDADGHRTDLAYDGLGRLTGVWQPDRPRAANPTPSTGYSYSVSDTDVSAVGTTTLLPDGATSTSYTLYDGLLRPVQTQSPSPGGGRIVTDTGYDAAGRVASSTAPYFNLDRPPLTSLFKPSTAIPATTTTSYDGAGRTTSETSTAANGPSWSTSYAYGGDHVDVTPPAGGTPSTTWTDARGKTTRLAQYDAATPTGPSRVTTYAYNGRGDMTRMSDPAGDVWTWTFDALGRQSAASDPDKGATSTVFDAAGRVASTTDARGTTLAYSYDVLDRKTGEYAGSVTPANQLAAWSYDSLAKGKLTSSTRYTAGASGPAYLNAVTGYDAAGRATGSSVTIPAAAGVLAGTYTSAVAYNPDGSVASTTAPAAGGLPAEKLTSAYDSDGLLAVYGGDQTYLAYATYTHLGQLAQTSTTNGLTAVYDTLSYQAGTGRLTADLTTTGAPTGFTAADRGYSYDPAGNVTAVATHASGQPDQTQCLTYDHFRQLTGAWTPDSPDCAAAPDTAALGGPAPFWTSYAYDLIGDRTQTVSHAAGGDATDTYAYPAPGPSAARPHAVTTVTHAGTGTGTDSYGYDAAGNTTSRPGQSLTYDAAGRLAAATSGGDSTSIVYDADGNRLLDTTTDGSATLYLGDTQLSAGPGGIVRGTRVYTALGRPVAVRTATTGQPAASSLSWLAADPHHTAETAVDSATGTITRRHLDPFGVTLDTNTPAWPDQRGFLNAPVDPLTGLTHLGARDYDPTLGRFTTVDPLLDPANPQQAAGYSYADNNPATHSDPTGLIVDCGVTFCGFDYKPPPSTTSGAGPAAPGNLPSISRDRLNHLREYVDMVRGQQPDKWDVPGTSAYNAIMVTAKKDYLGTPGFGDYIHALAGPTVSLAIGAIGLALCPETAGLACAAAVGGLAGLAGACVSDCTDIQGLVIAAIVGTVAGYAGGKLAGSAAADTAATSGRSVDEVLNSLPKGKQSFVRTVPDEQTLQSTFGDLTRGGTPTTWKGYNGQVFELQDGTQIGMRGTSSSGGSTIDIRIPGQDPFKIHIG